jgi:hypothetical protein
MVYTAIKSGSSIRPKRFVKHYFPLRYITSLVQVRNAESAKTLQGSRPLSALGRKHHHQALYFSFRPCIHTHHNLLCISLAGSRWPDEKDGRTCPTKPFVGRTFKVIGSGNEKTIVCHDVGHSESRTSIICYPAIQ